MQVLELIRRLGAAPAEWEVVDSEGVKVEWVEIGDGVIILNTE